MKFLFLLVLIAFSPNGVCQSVSIKDLLQLTYYSDTLKINDYVVKQGFKYTKSYREEYKRRTWYSNNEKFDFDYRNLPSGYQEIRIEFEYKLTSVAFGTSNKVQYETLMAELSKESLPFLTKGVHENLAYQVFRKDGLTVNSTSYYLENDYKRPYWYSIRISRER